MSGGYGAVFSSIATGTLFGRWPDIGLWAFILSQCDKNGVLDVTHEYLSAVTGLELEELRRCMNRFRQPDAASRSVACSGARLELLDPARDWGWRVINHALYRERARKQASDADRAASGRNAQRMRERRDPTRPAKTRGDPPSDADSDTNIKNARSAPASPSGARAALEKISIEKLQFRRMAIGIPDFRDASDGETAEAYRAAQEQECRKREGRPRSRYQGQVA